MVVNWYFNSLVEECNILKCGTYLYILLDGVEGIITRDLEFGLLPTRDFHDHVGNALLLVDPEGDIVEGGNHVISFFFMTVFNAG